MTGFDNEKQIIEVLDNVQFSKLNNNLKKAILKINNNKKPSIILAKKYGGHDKADLSIILDGKEYSISVKMGSGNSVHQEPVEGFITYLKNSFDDNKSVFDDLRHFTWCDETLDGTGLFSARMSVFKYKKNYPLKIKNIQSYFDKHINELLKRFLIRVIIKCFNNGKICWHSTPSCSIYILNCF